MMFDQYKRIAVINRASRRDRRKQMAAELKRIGVTDYYFAPAYRPDEAGPFRSIGEYGCFLSHLNILRNAGLCNESVLILEDDCDFTAAVRDRRPPSDIMWGGYKIHPEYIEGAHCMGFSAAAVRCLVPYIEKLLADGPIPIDGAYIWFCRDNPNLAIDACNPMIAVQRPSTSDIGAAEGLARVPLASPLVSVIRAAKRTVKRRQVEGGSFNQLVEWLREDRDRRIATGQPATSYSSVSAP